MADYKEGSAFSRGLNYPRPTGLVAQIKDYIKAPEPIKAIYLKDKAALETAALWCGGEVRREQFHTGEDWALVYPRLDIPGIVRVGGYLSLNRATGRFEGWTKKSFEDAGYQEHGKRQDGLTMRSAEPYQDTINNPALIRAQEDYYRHNPGDEVLNTD